MKKTSRLSLIKKGGGARIFKLLRYLLSPSYKGLSLTRKPLRKKYFLGLPYRTLILEVLWNRIPSYYNVKNLTYYSPYLLRNSLDTINLMILKNTRPSWGIKMHKKSTSAWVNFIGDDYSKKKRLTSLKNKKGAAFQSNWSSSGSEWESEISHRKSLEGEIQNRERRI